jgi:hypothetical protein
MSTLVCGLPIWQMIRKAFSYGTGAGGWFWNEGEKIDLLHLHPFKTVQIYEKEREYKYFKVNVVDMPKELKGDPGMIIGHIQLHCYVIGVSEETLCQSSYTPKKAIFLLGVEPVPYKLFLSLYPIVLMQKRRKEIIG